MPPANATNHIPQRRENGETSDQLTFFAPRGQLALGATFDAGAGSPEPRSGESFLGQATPGFATGDGAPTDAYIAAEQKRLLEEALKPPRRLELKPAAWEAPRQLTMWPQLRARIPLVPSRQAKCQHTRYRSASDVIALRTNSNRWQLSGVVSCGRITCPCCGRRKARSTSARLGVCFERHRDKHPEGDHWMLTLAAPHRIDDGVATVNTWLYGATSRFFRSRQWQEFSSRWGITARVRVYDATHGGRNGTHPHFHVALFPSVARVEVSRLLRLKVVALKEECEREERARKRAKRERSKLTTNAEREEDRAFELAWAERLMTVQALYEQALEDDSTELLRDAWQDVRRMFLRELALELLPAWRAALKVAGCPHSVSANAVDLLPSEKAEAYFLKWGLAEEIGLSVEKDRSHLRLLDIVCAQLGEQSDIAADLYRDFNVAMKGRAWVTGMADTCKRYGVTDEDAAAFVECMRERRNRELERAGEAPLPEVPKLSLTIRAHLWRAFLLLGHEQVFSWLDATTEELAHDETAVQVALDGFLSRHHALTCSWNTS